METQQQVRQCSTTWGAVWPGFAQLWHYCPHFAQLMTLAHTLLQIMWINAPPLPSCHSSCGSCRRRLISSHSSLEGWKIICSINWLWFKFDPRLRSRSAWTAAAQPAVCLTDERHVPGDKDADSGGVFFFFFFISSLVRWRCFFLFRPF